MAIRVRAQLRKWFGRGMYPTAEQFSDLFDSFFHKTEDKIPMSGVEGLTDQLNGKYNTAEGRELEKRVQKVTDDLSVHVASSEKAFNEVQNDIEALDGRLDDEIERAKGEEAAIRRELAAGDAATLSSAKSYTDTSVAAEAGKREQGDATTLQAAKTYTDTSVAAEAEERTQGDATTLSSAKTYTDTSVADEAQKRGQGDAATLQSANSHADAAVASEKSARESGDRTTLESAKAYVDKAIAELVDGSPAALDTLKELSAALGNDPNFATTVATQIGQKVDKVAGKGLSTEDYTSEEKAKLAGVAAGANNYQHPATHPATMIEQDASHRFVTDTEKTTWNGKASTAVVTQSANGLMSAADKKKLDGVAAGANNYQHPATHPASVIVQDSTHRFVTDTEKTTWNGKASTTVATQSANGLMSAADKKKLDGVATGANNYQHPATHPASVIVQDSTHRFVTDTEKSSWNNKAARDVATQISKGLMSALDKEKLDCISAQCLISTSTTTVSGTLDLSSNVSYTKGKGYISSIRLLAQSATSLTIDSTVLATDDLPLIVELVLRCRAGLASNLNLSILLAGDASNSSITIPKGSKLITLSFMMLNGHTDKYSCYRVSVI